MKPYRKITAFLIVLAITLSACAPAAATGTTAPVPTTREAAEKELTAFTFDYIVRQVIGDTADYAQTADAPWTETPADASIIIWDPPAQPVNESAGDFIQQDAPQKVWLFAENKLVETTDVKGTIQNYKQTRMTKPGAGLWTWGYYEFAITSLSADFQGATIYISASCGPFCGQGIKLTVGRGISGKWTVTESKVLWKS
jgi:hypothetical protein